MLLSFLLANRVHCLPQHVAPANTRLSPNLWSPQRARLADGSSDVEAAPGQRCRAAGAQNPPLFSVPDLSAKDSRAQEGTVKVTGIETNLGSSLFPSRMAGAMADTQ